MLLILALRRQRWADLCEFKFKASLVYRVSSRTVKATQRNPVSKNKHTKHTKLSEDTLTTPGLFCYES